MFAKVQSRFVLIAIAAALILHASPDGNLEPTISGIEEIDFTEPVEILETSATKPESYETLASREETEISKNCGTSSEGETPEQAKGTAGTNGEHEEEAKVARREHQKR